jgi:sulfatase modifying factor 1
MPPSIRAIGVAVLCAAAVGVFAWLAPARPEEETARRFALVVGVKDYKGTGLSDLKYTENDARDLAEVFRGQGYRRVVVLTQQEAFTSKQRNLFPTVANIRLHLKAVLEDRRPGDTVVLALSGHGVHLKKQNALFFCPEGANLDDPKTLLPLEEVYKELEGCKAGVRLLLVDACRDDPLEGKGAGDERLESVTRPLVPDPPKGVAAIFSCSKGQKSYESDAYKHGYFSHYLIEGLKGGAKNKRGDVTLPGLVDYLASEVPEAVKEKDASYRQSPDPRLGIEGLVTLARADVRPRPADGGEVVPDKEFTNTVGMKLVRVPKGTFQMGSADDDKDALADEKPRHEVTIGKGFYLGKHEVTRGQFRKFAEATGYETEAEKDGKGSWGYDEETGKFDQNAKYTWKNAGFIQTDDHPVVNVTWNDAKKFCGWLSEKEKKGYDLPTEAEWEYACRAGTQTRFHGGDGEEVLEKTANIADASFKRKYKDGTWAKEWDDGYPFTAPVGKFAANQYGLHDMHGNVWEWCQDWYGKDYYANSDKKDPEGPSSGDARVLRGGSFNNDARVCRAAYRHRRAPALRFSSIGFRVRLRLD